MSYVLKKGGLKLNFKFLDLVIKNFNLFLYWATSTITFNLLVVGSRIKHQVLNSVITLNAVNMVNLLIGHKATSETFRHHKSMFGNLIYTIATHTMEGIRWVKVEGNITSFINSSTPLPFRAFSTFAVKYALIISKLNTLTHRTDRYVKVAKVKPYNISVAIIQGGYFSVA